MTPPTVAGGAGNVASILGRCRSCGNDDARLTTINCSGCEEWHRRLRDRNVRRAIAFLSGKASDYVPEGYE